MFVSIYVYAWRYYKDFLIPSWYMAIKIFGRELT